jgi:hypothetical protein
MVVYYHRSVGLVYYHRTVESLRLLHLLSTSLGLVYYRASPSPRLIQQHRKVYIAVFFFLLTQPELFYFS